METEPLFLKRCLCFANLQPILSQQGFLETTSSILWIHPLSGGLAVVGANIIIIIFIIIRYQVGKERVERCRFERIVTVALDDQATRFVLLYFQQQIF
jgi:hypothetical protein